MQPIEPVPRAELLCKKSSRRQAYATSLFRWHLILSAGSVSECFESYHNSERRSSTIRCSPREPQGHSH